MKDKYKIRNQRISLKQQLEKADLSIVLQLLQTQSIVAAQTYIRLQRRTAFLLVNQEDIQKTICWNCKEATNAHNACCWSRDLVERQDWTVDRDETGIHVLNCPGFNLDDSKPMPRKMLNQILSDFFVSYSTLLNLEYFQHMDTRMVNNWLDIYNKLMSYLDISPLYINTFEGEDYED